METVLVPRIPLKCLKAADYLNGCEGFRGRWLPEARRFVIYLKQDRKKRKAKLENVDVVEDPRLTGSVVSGCGEIHCLQRRGRVYAPSQVRSN